MSLLDELNELSPGFNGVSEWTVLEAFDDVAMISNEYQDSGRWSEYWKAVFQRGDEFVALDYEKPATEMQEGGDFYHEFYLVKPVEVTVTQYVKI